MSEAKKTEDGKHALLEELLVIHDMLRTEDSTHSNESESYQTSPPDHARVTRQIPLLQEILDPERLNEQIQLEQLKAVGSSILADKTFPGSTGFSQSIDLIDPSASLSVPIELYEKDELQLSAGGSLEEAPNQESVELSYSDYQEMFLSETADSISPPNNASLSTSEADEFIELLIEENVDEILDLFRSILRDKLSLLVAQSRDIQIVDEQLSGHEKNPPISADTASDPDL